MSAPATLSAPVTSSGALVPATAAVPHQFNSNEDDKTNSPTIHPSLSSSSSSSLSPPSVSSTSISAKTAVSPEMTASPSSSIIDIIEHAIDDDQESEFDYEALPENTSIVANLLAGATAGIMEHTVMYPVDAIKTRMQVANSPKVYTGIVNAVSKISAAEGAFSLWRGISSMVMGAGPAHAVYFGVYEAVKLRLGGQDGNHHPLVSAVAGASATISSDALMNPFDVMKQRMQINTKRYPSMLSCMSSIYRTEGLSAFYVSYPTTLIMNIPFAAVNFTVYDSASRFLNPERKYDPLVHCIAGGMAGASAAAVTTPLDVVKTVLQTKGLFSPSETAGKLNSFMDGVRYIYNMNGMSGFARGMRPRIVANMPSTAICWTSYEMAKFYLHKSNVLNNPK